MGGRLRAWRGARRRGRPSGSGRWFLWLVKKWVSGTPEGLDMSRFVKIYPECLHGLFTIAITQIREQEEASYIEFECYCNWSTQWSGPRENRTREHVYLIRNHKCSWRDAIWEGLSVAASDTTTDLERAHPYLRGYINEGGRSEMIFEDQPLFFDGRIVATSLGTLMNELYDIARDLLPDFYETATPHEQPGLD